MEGQELLKSIRTVPDFPKPGILFYDIGTLLADPYYFKRSLDAFEELARESECDCIAAIESRGFIFGAPLADRLDKGFVLLRKLGKLPGKTLKHSYDLEYGSSALELSDVVLKPKQRVLLIDDVLATGGTASAAVKLLEQTGATVVSTLFLLELKALEGRARLEGISCQSLIEI